MRHLYLPQPFDTALAVRTGRLPGRRGGAGGADAGRCQGLALAGRPGGGPLGPARRTARHPAARAGDQPAGRAVPRGGGQHAGGLSRAVGRGAAAGRRAGVPAATDPATPGPHVSGDPVLRSGRGRHSAVRTRAVPDRAAAASGSGSRRPVRLGRGAGGSGSGRHVPGGERPGAAVAAAVRRRPPRRPATDRPGRGRGGGDGMVDGRGGLGGGARRRGDRERGRVQPVRGVDDPGVRLAVAGPAAVLRGQTRTACWDMRRAARCGPRVRSVGWCGRAVRPPASPTGLGPTTG